jgi:hypothetical protein
MKANPGHSDGDVLVALAAVGLLLATVAGATVGIVAQMARLSPEVGDIVAFDHARPVPDDDLRSVVSAFDDAGGACILDSAVMAQSGGSLVVEAKQPDGRFRVHWAGGPTSRDSANCGRSANLILTMDDIEGIAVGAGGFGVGPKKLAFASPFRATAPVVD